MSLLSGLKECNGLVVLSPQALVDSKNIENGTNETKQATEHGKQQLLATVRSNIARKASKQKQP